MLIRVGLSDLTKDSSTHLMDTLLAPFFTVNASLCLNLDSLQNCLLPPEEVDGGKAFQGALSGVIIGTALSLGVSTVKASFVAGVVAAFVALVPILGGIDVEDQLENEGENMLL